MRPGRLAAATAVVWPPALGLDCADGVVWSLRPIPEAARGPPTATPGATPGVARVRVGGAAGWSPRRQDLVGLLARDDQLVLLAGDAGDLARRGQVLRLGGEGPVLGLQLGQRRRGRGSVRRWSMRAPAGNHATSTTAATMADANSATTPRRRAMAARRSVPGHRGRRADGVRDPRGRSPPAARALSPRHGGRGSDDRPPGRRHRGSAPIRRGPLRCAAAGCTWRPGPTGPARRP